jgi:enoyl-CoA hydratase/carnithine racemase
VSDERVAIEDRDGVRVVAFDRPEVRNAFDLAMYDAVDRALRSSLEDDGVHVVVVTGRGKAFSAGQDLREMAAIATGAAGDEAGSGFRRLLDTLVAFDKPLLAAVHGVAIGLGCTILGHVDLALVEVGTRLRAPFAEMGVPPEGASSLLFPARMGWQRAASVLLVSEWLDAHQAVDAGLALRVCPAGTVLEETLAIAARIASYPPHATRTIKRLMAADHAVAVGAARTREEAAFAVLFADPDHNPGAQLAAGLDR